MGSSCAVIDGDGTLFEKQRKVQLFYSNVPGEINVPTLPKSDEIDCEGNAVHAVQALCLLYIEVLCDLTLPRAPLYVSVVRIPKYL